MLSAPKSFNGRLQLGLAPLQADHLGLGRLFPQRGGQGGLFHQVFLTVKLAPGKHGWEIQLTILNSWRFFFFGVELGKSSEKSRIFFQQTMELMTGSISLWIGTANRLGLQRPMIRRPNTSPATRFRTKIYLGAGQSEDVHTRGY